MDFQQTERLNKLAEEAELDKRITDSGPQFFDDPNPDIKEAVLETIQHVASVLQKENEMAPDEILEILKNEADLDLARHPNSRTIDDYTSERKEAALETIKRIRAVLKADVDPTEEILDGYFISHRGWFKLFLFVHQYNYSLRYPLIGDLKKHRENLEKSLRWVKIDITQHVRGTRREILRRFLKDEMGISD